MYSLCAVKNILYYVLFCILHKKYIIFNLIKITQVWLILIEMHN